jgi:protein-arginine kinase activator protein McsA
MSSIHRDLFVSKYGSEYDAEQEAQIQSEDTIAEAICDNCGFESEIEIGVEEGCHRCSVGFVRDLVTVLLVD